MAKYKDIKDDEIRVIGATKTKKSLSWVWMLLVSLVSAGIIVTLLFTFIGKDADSKAVLEPELEMKDVPVVFEPSEQPTKTPEPVKWLGNYSDDSKSYTEHLKDSINDVALDIYIPHNAVPELMLGVPDIHDKSIILTTQAADVRADNGKIVGAFVLNGKPLSWGLSKRGYCGIIDGKISIGVAENSPLFEEATEKGGYFFRQYPLVDNGVLVENEPKGKSVRKALCDRNGEIMVIMTKNPESFHDFAQALVDMKVDNAVYLVGSTSFGYFRDRYDHLAIIYNKLRFGYKYENFIVWKVKPVTE